MKYKYATPLKNLYVQAKFYIKAQENAVTLNELYAISHAADRKILSYLTLVPYDTLRTILDSKDRSFVQNRYRISRQFNKYIIDIEKRGEKDAEKEYNEI